MNKLTGGVRSRKCKSGSCFDHISRPSEVYKQRIFCKRKVIDRTNKIETNEEAMHTTILAYPSPTRRLKQKKMITTKNFKLKNDNVILMGLCLETQIMQKDIDKFAGGMENRSEKQDFIYLLTGKQILQNIKDIKFIKNWK